jgi:hypothetical protein
MLVSHNSLDQTTLSFVLNPKTDETREIGLGSGDLGFKDFSFPPVNLGKVQGVYKEIYNVI